MLIIISVENVRNGNIIENVCSSMFNVVFVVLVYFCN